MEINIKTADEATADDVREILSHISTYVSDSHLADERLNEAIQKTHLEVIVGNGSHYWEEAGPNMGTNFYHIAIGPKGDTIEGEELNGLQAKVLRRRLTEPDADPTECMCFVSSTGGVFAAAYGWHHEVGCPKRPEGDPPDAS